MKRYISPFVILIFLLSPKFLLATQVSMNQLDQGKYSSIVSISEGEDAELESKLLDSLDPVKQVLNVEGQKLEISQLQFEDVNSLKTAALQLTNKVDERGLFGKMGERVKRAVDFEYGDKSLRTVMMRTATFVVSSGISAYIWSLKGEMDAKTFVAITYSMIVSATFTFMEDHADKIWYRTNAMSKVSTWSLKLYNKMKAFLAQSEAQFPSYHTEFFLRRLYSTIFVDVLIVAGYEVIKRFPNVADPSLLLEVGLKVITGMAIGYGFSFSRSYLKDMVAEQKLHQKFVDMYSFGSKVFMAGVYYTLFSDLVEKQSLLLQVGVPGWLLAFLLHPVTRAHISNTWLSLEAVLRAGSLAFRLWWGDLSIDKLSVSKLRDELLRRGYYSSEFDFKKPLLRSTDSKESKAAPFCSLVF